MTADQRPSKMSTEFFASNIGGTEPRVLARFITDGRGVHVERFDRRGGRWVQDSSVAGFFTGRDGFAQQIPRARAQELLRSWEAIPGSSTPPWSSQRPL